jgi:23S rRNA (uridine2552-2'-O)-methyltransferase
VEPASVTCSPAQPRGMLQDTMVDKKKPLSPTGKKNRHVKAWMQQHVNDHWVQEAQRLGYRSRAAFKLAELAEKDKLFRPGMAVVDLGSAPGSWSQLLHERLGRSARIVALDLAPMDPIPGVRFLQADFREPEGLEVLASVLQGRKVDLVVSDLAPNLSGVESADQARSVHLGELALEFAVQCLQPGGNLVVKAFQGEGFDEFHRSMQIHFAKVYVRKPKASRDRSREVYLVAKGFNGLSPADDRNSDKTPSGRASGASSR